MKITTSYVQRQQPPLTEAEDKRLKKLLRPQKQKPVEPAVEISDFMSQDSNAHIETQLDEMAAVAETARWHIAVLSAYVKYISENKPAVIVASMLADFDGTQGIAKAIKADLADLNAALDEASEKCAELFATDEIDKMTVRGATVYLHGSLRVKLECDQGDLVHELHKAGLDELISESVPMPRLTSWLKENKSDDAPITTDNQIDGYDIPDALKPLLYVATHVEARVRKGKS